MKTHQTFILLMCISFAACKKESPTQYSINAGGQQDALIQCKTCREINPSNFVKGVDNPYFPLVPGTSFYYVNRVIENGDTSYEHIKVAVTSNIKWILGVPCTVVHDVVKEDGIITEDTYDWYAQDKHGNVWYFGENTKARTDTGWTTEGSWEAGRHGACAGIAMWAHPGLHIGEIYYQEFLKGVAEDQAEVLNINSTVRIRYGTFTNCVETKEFTRLEPGVIEHKYYARNVGQLLTVMTKGGNEREVLIRITH